MMQFEHSNINRCLGHQLWGPNGDETNKHQLFYTKIENSLLSPKLTWNIWNLKMSFIFRFQVNFRGSNGLLFSKTFSRSQLFRDVLAALEKWKRFVSCRKFLGVYNSPWSEWVYMGGILRGMVIWLFKEIPPLCWIDIHVPTISSHR